MVEEERFEHDINIHILSEFLKREGVFKFEPQHMGLFVLIVSIAFIETVEEEGAGTIALVFVIVDEGLLSGLAFLYDLC